MKKENFLEIVRSKAKATLLPKMKFRCNWDAVEHAFQSDAVEKGRTN